MWSIAIHAFAKRAGLRNGTQNIKHPIRADVVTDARAPNVATASKWAVVPPFGGASYRWSHTEIQSTTPSSRCHRLIKSAIVAFCWPT
jgi:hypothetical protein